MIEPKRPHFISIENWDRMSWKEKDYVILLCDRKRTKEEIKRKLYITSDQGFWKLRKRVSKFINQVAGKSVGIE